MSLRGNTFIQSLLVGLLVLVSMPAARHFHGHTTDPPRSDGHRCDSATHAHDESPAGSAGGHTEHACPVCDLIASGQTSSIPAAPGLVATRTATDEAGPLEPVRSSHDCFVTQHGPRAPPCPV